MDPQADFIPISERRNLRYRDFSYYGISPGHARLMVCRGQLPRPRNPNGRNGVALFDRVELEVVLRERGFIS